MTPMDGEGPVPWYATDGYGDSTEQRGAMPQRWPAMAVASGVSDSVDEYYDELHSHLRSQLRTEVREVSEAEDVELLRTERLLQAIEAAVGDVSDRCDDLAPPDGMEAPPAYTVGRAAEAALHDHTEGLRELIDHLTRRVSPNLRAIAGPRLSAQLIEEAGGLQRLARKPSGTVQVLGAESALFAHLQGRGTSPKHGVIYTHPAVRHASQADRGTVARVLAGKLSIAARIDYYRGSPDEEFIADVRRRLREVRR